MRQQLLIHIDSHSLCKTTDKILLAVSGGIDSMVMLDLFRKSGFNIGVAHCNFQLRDRDSEQDQFMVSKMCELIDVPFFTTRFDTQRYADEHGLSIQMAARQLRYEFFEAVSGKENFNVIATAHNLNDVFETLLLNLTKGTGFEGLTGIPVKTGKIIRPLLFADRKMIEAYAKANVIEWREDVSNSSDDYQRNFIRHRVVPALREINPNLEDTFRNTVERLCASSSITKKYLANFKSENVSHRGGEYHMNIDAIRREAFSAVILWELIKDYGFNFSQCKTIVTDHSPGRVFFSTEFELVVDREHYIIHTRDHKTFDDVMIDSVIPVVNNGSESLMMEERQFTAS